MADWVTISGVRPYDGRYELDLEGSPLTTREWGWVKRHAGYLPVTIGDDGFTDPEFVAVLACIALRRTGTIEPKDVGAVFDRIADAPFGSTITLETDAAVEDGDAGPPPASSTSNGTSSGTGSTTPSARSDSRPSRTGSPALDTSVSVPVTSAS